MKALTRVVRLLLFGYVRAFLIATFFYVLAAYVRYGDRWAGVGSVLKNGLGFFFPTLFIILTFWLLWTFGSLMFAARSITRGTGVSVLEYLDLSPGQRDEMIRRKRKQDE